jgi:hypothetical protein
MKEIAPQRILYYQYQVFSSRSEDVYATIHLHGSEGSIATAYFLRSDSVAAASQKDKADANRLYFIKNEFTDVIDMLRNEKPVYFSSQDGGIKRLSTGLEAEGKGR